MSCFGGDSVSELTDIPSEQEIPRMTAGFSDSDKQAGVYSNIGSMFVNWSDWTEDRLGCFSSFTLLFSTWTREERKGFSRDKKLLPFLFSS